MENKITDDVFVLKLSDLQLLALMDLVEKDYNYQQGLLKELHNYHPTNIKNEALTQLGNMCLLRNVLAEALEPLVKKNK